VVPITDPYVDLITGPLRPYVAPMHFHTTIQLAAIRRDEIQRDAAATRRHHHRRTATKGTNR